MFLALAKKLPSLAKRRIEKDSSTMLPAPSSI
jgi:hypothetical protein